MLDPRDAIRAIGASSPFCTTTTISHLYLYSTIQVVRVRVRQDLRRYARLCGPERAGQARFSCVLFPTPPRKENKKERKKEIQGQGRPLRSPFPGYGCCWDLWNGVELGRPFRNLDLHWYFATQWTLATTRARVRQKSDAGLGVILKSPNPPTGRRSLVRHAPTPINTRRGTSGMALSREHSSVGVLDAPPQNPHRRRMVDRGLDLSLMMAHMPFWNDQVS